MNRILILFNEIVTPARVISFAVQTAKDHPALLHGIFLKELSEESEKYSFPNDLQSTEETAGEESVNEPIELATDSAEQFAEQCRSGGISFEISKGASINQIIGYSRDAILLITDAELEVAESTLGSLLEGLHCPAYLVGINAPVIETIMLGYDGTDVSRHTIQKFSVLFPAMTHLPAYIMKTEATDTDNDEAEYTQFVGKLFPNSTPKLIKENAKEEWLQLLEEHQDNVVVVLGSPHRNTLSRFFHHSLTDDLLRGTRVSFFIAHE